MTAGNYIFTSNDNQTFSVAANTSTEIGGIHGINVNSLNFTNITSFNVVYSEGQFTPLFDNLVFELASTNAAPTITGAPSDITVTEDTASNVALSGVTLADSDGDNLTVTLTTSAGTLAASSAGSVTVSGSGTGALTLAGTATNINTYLDTTTNIQYTGATNARGDNAATLTIKANDGTVDSSTSTVNVDITAVDNAATFGFETGVSGLGTKTVTAVGADTTFTIESESAELLDSDNGGFTDANLSGSESIDTGYDPAETKLTFSIEPGKQFDLSSLMLQSWDGDNEIFVLTSVKGSIEFIVLDTTPATIATLDIANHINADFFKGITSFTLTENTVDGESSGFYITFDDLVVTNITAIPANAAPAITGAPSDITVTEDTVSNVDLSGVTFADSDGDNLTVTLTASAGTLAASSGGSVTVSGSGTGALTLFGTAANINTYLDTTSNIQYTGASNAGGDNAATLTIKANDGTVDSSTTTINVDITAVNDAPVFTSSNNASVAENTTAVTTLAATDADGDTLTYSISGGADQALFSLESNSGALTFINAPDFEAPGDNNGDNVYAVEVTANDDHGGTTPLTLTVSVTDANEAPTLTGVPQTNVSENSTGTIYTATGSDPENNALTYALSGTDALLFDLNANSGALSFKTAPDFEAPVDAGGNNVYDVILIANDGTLNSNSQALAITVTDVNETQPPTPTPTPEPEPTPVQVTPPEPQPSTPSGRPSVRETITNTGRDPGTAKLVENSGNANEVTATLPGGVSLVNQGARTAVDPLQALGDLVNSIDAQQPTNLNEQTGVASQWLTNRPQGTLLDIRTLVISESGSSSISTPVQITGIGNANSSHQEAFVIDVRLLPQGNRLQLDNIDFASIIGETMITGGAGANVIVADDAAQMIVLGEDDDELHAGGGRDLVGSKGGDDLIFGEAGYDRLFGGEGNDVLNGGSGVDVARFTIDAASADLRYTDDGSLIVSAGELGTDTLISVELLRFDDQVVLVNAPAPQSVIGFDEASYLATNSDVAIAVERGDFENGIAHYAQHGRQEGRHGELNGFDEAFYLAQNPDVAAAVSRGEFVSGFHHYLRWGYGEGRDPNALFDEAWYRAQNPDVNHAIELGVFDNSYEHYLAFGNAEQRLPSAWFDTADYLATHQDVAEALFNPVLHYLSYGVNEGRVIVADDAGLWG